MSKNLITKPTPNSSLPYMDKSEIGTELSSSSLIQVPPTPDRTSALYDALSKFLEFSSAKVKYRSIFPYQTTLNSSTTKLEIDNSITKINHADLNYSRFSENLSENFQKTFQRLLELKELDSDMEDEDEDEIYLPTEEAFSASVTLLIKLYQFLSYSFPLGYTSVDSRGGINFIWKNIETSKEVRFNLPASQSISKPSVYYRQSSDSSLEEKPSVERLAELLKWLFSN